jgi:hypothetical protein
MTNGPPPHRFLEILDTQKITNGIIIFSDKMTPSARKACLYCFYRGAALTAYIDYFRNVSRIYARRVRRSKSPGQHYTSRFSSSTRSPHPRGKEASPSKIVRSSIFSGLAQAELTPLAELKTLSSLEFNSVIPLLAIMG